MGRPIGSYNDDYIGHIKALGAVRQASHIGGIYQFIVYIVMVSEDRAPPGKIRTGRVLLLEASLYQGQDVRFIINNMEDILQKGPVEQ